ncbi:hypothetical protein [Pedobacter immunditicola]|uniref:hypothetical protein n=1 Tax=Pedobacter immunditicola TaxID=3133440 RepID=UPI0030A2A10A
MKNLIMLISLVFFLCSCKNPGNEIASENYIELSDDLKRVVSRYIDYQPCNDCMYEIYFDKIEPHYHQVILYKGDNSLTVDEHQRSGRSPILYTTIIGKKIYLFTGGERYFRSSKKVMKTKKILGSASKSFDVWVLSDSLNERRIDTFEHVYPFLPLPAKREFPTPF